MTMPPRTPSQRLAAAGLGIDRLQATQAELLKIIDEFLERHVDAAVLAILEDHVGREWIDVSEEVRNTIAQQVSTRMRREHRRVMPPAVRQQLANFQLAVAMDLERDRVPKSIFEAKTERAPTLEFPEVKDPNEKK
jgi:hypothetical protein